MENGQIKGPFPSESISKMIVEGILTGQEEVAQHPSAEWRPLAKVHEFYEALLESLENPTERDEKKAAKMDAETQVQSMSADNAVEVPSDVEEAPEFKDEIKQLVEEEMKKPVPAIPDRSPAIRTPGVSSITPPDNNALLVARDQQLTIEMQQLKIIQAKESKKFFPFIILILLAAVGLYWVLKPEAKQNSGWVLIAPNRGVEKN